MQIDRATNMLRVNVDMKVKLVVGQAKVQLVDGKE